MSNFKERNSVILEMLEKNKNDRDFGKQLVKAKKETKEFINQLIKTLDLQEENNESSE